MKEFIEKFANNLLIAAFIPALTFWGIVAFLFSPLLPTDITTRILKITESPGIAIICVSVISAFVLSHLSFQIQHFFMGESIAQKFPKSVNSHIRQYASLTASINENSLAIENLEMQLYKAHKSRKKSKSDEEITDLDIRFHKLASKNFEDKVFLGKYYPPQQSKILPTRLGNILIAAEYYPLDRYGIDTETIWPRLVRFIPQEEFSKIETSYNRLFFLLNMSMAAFLIGILAGVALISQLLSDYFSIHDISAYIISFQRLLTNSHNAILYFVAMIFSFVASRFFYNAALPVAIEYGNTIKTAFDQFRFKILKQLGVQLPQNNDEEIDLWSGVSEFLCFGHNKEYSTFIHYNYSDQDVENK